MTCPVCNGNAKVAYTYDKDDHVVRDRKCRECGYRFQTIEADEDMFFRSKKEQKTDAKYQKIIREFKAIVSRLSELEKTND